MKYKVAHKFDLIGAMKKRKMSFQDVVNKVGFTRQYIQMVAHEQCWAGEKLAEKLLKLFRDERNK